MNESHCVLKSHKEDFHMVVEDAISEHTINGADSRFIHIFLGYLLISICSSVNISAFMGRWHLEMNYLHLPFAKMKSTLDNVSSLLDLPVTGKSMCQCKGPDAQLAVDLLIDSLGVNHTETFNDINTKVGTSIGLIGRLIGQESG